MANIKTIHLDLDLKFSLIDKLLKV
jgi:hypothetical protein